MRVYNYSPVTGEYLGESEAQIDPLESKGADHNIFLIPAHATIIKPPVAPDGVSVFNTMADEWDDVEDHRGRAFHNDDGEPISITQLGPVPPGLLEGPPPPPAITHADVNKERDRRIFSTFGFEAKAYQADQYSRQNIADAAQNALAAIVAGADPEGLRWHGGNSDFVWVSEDNTIVPMTAAMVLSFAKTAALHKMALTFAGKAIKEQDPIPADYAYDGLWADSGA